MVLEWGHLGFINTLSKWDGAEMTVCISSLSQPSKDIVTHVATRCCFLFPVFGLWNIGCLDFQILSDFPISHSQQVKDLGAPFCDRKLNFMANMWRPQFHIIDGGKRHIFGPYSCTKSKLRCVTSRARISVPTLPTKVQYPIHTVPDWIKYKSPIYFPENFKVI